MRIIVALQALYYLITGIWPMVSLRTFEAITGPKTDDWLVQMVGLLAFAIGATLLFSCVRRRPNREAFMLAILSAASFAAIDVIYALNDTISPIYLADAAVQLIIIAALLATLILPGKQPQ